jgi:hypothetical protein
MRYSRHFAIMAIAVCMVAGVAQLAYARNTNWGPAFVGTWNLDTAKSDFGKMAPPKSETLVIISSTQTSEKWTQDLVDADGKEAKMSYDGAVDDKFYPIVGDPDENTFAFMRDGSWAVKDKSGKVVETGTASVSADGKTLTLHVVRHTADGDLTTTSVYQKAG